MSANVFPTPPLPFTRLATISTSTTWDHPDGYSQPRPIRVITIAGGGGGAGGAVNNGTAGAIVTGGGGGAGGTINMQDTFISSQATITVGAGGTAGAAVTIIGAGSTAGNAGGEGGDTIFSSSTNYLKTYYQPWQDIYGTNGGKGNGTGGTSFSPGSTSPNGSTVPVAGGSFGYGKSSSSIPYSLYIGAAGQVWPPTFGPYCPGGGGAGSNITSAGTINAAGAGGFGFLQNNGGAGGTGARSTTANGTATGTAGSAASQYGGGGGGGGAAQVVNAVVATANSTSGAGGVGRAGVVYIYY